MPQQPIQGLAGLVPSSLSSGHHTRTASATSSLTAHERREVLSETLDRIHTSASQSEGLTAFNAFSSPPRPCSIAEYKDHSGDTGHNGLSGLYSKFRGAIEAAKEKAEWAIAGSEQRDARPPSTHQSVASSSDDANIAHNHTLSTATTALSTQLSTQPPSQQIHQPATILAGSTHGSINITSKKAADLPTPVGVGATAVAAKVPLAPFTKPTVSAAAIPRVAPVNVTAKSVGKNPDAAGDPVLSGNLVLSGQPASTNNIARSSTEVSALPRLTADATSLAGTATLTNTGDKLVKPGGKEHGEKPEGIDTDRERRVSQVPKGETYSLIQDSSSIKAPDQDLTSIPRSSDTVVSTPGEPSVKALAIGASQDKAGSRSSSSSQRDTVGIHAIQPAISVTETRDEKPSPSGDKPAAETFKSTVPTDMGVNLSRLPGYRLSRASSIDGDATSSDVLSTLDADISSERRFKAQRKMVESRPQPSSPTADPSHETNFNSQRSRNKILSKDFWMRDENCKECFLCGDLFSAWRRKHHCRTCGQIFDAKCTALISGHRFGLSGSIKVCKPCMEIINGYEHAEAVDSDDASPAGTSPIQEQTIAVNEMDQPLGTHNPVSQSFPTEEQRSFATPMMAIHATRTAGAGSKRGSAVLEIDIDQHLSRPGSSKSLRSMTNPRPLPSMHKRHRSRNQLSRSFRSVPEERPPFHRNPTEETQASARFSAFHHDNIIDPDLAAYMTDEGSSADERMSLSVAMNSELGLPSQSDQDRSSLSYLLTSSRKSRSRMGDASTSALPHASHDADDGSGPASRGGVGQATPRIRTGPAHNSTQYRLLPKIPRGPNILKTFGSAIPDVLGNLKGSTQASSPPRASPPRPTRSRMTRSASMRGASAPAVELNDASLQHVRKLLRQLLHDSKVPGVDVWERALMPILLQGTDDVNPDVARGDDIDIRHYVKIKRIPGGHPPDTSYVSGVVFTKNLALKSMSRSISHPRIVIITFPIEYHRHQQHFMSLEPVIAQEKEYITNLVNRIVALAPHVLLVQRNVSGLALQFLAEAGVATAYNIKPSVLEAVARCAQADVISSVDMLLLKSVQVGRCAGFDAKTYVHKNIPNRKKTYLYVSGCPPYLGCTIVLRGETMQRLASLKRITEFMVYVVYNLKLETCLMRDEFVLIPSVPVEGTLVHGVESEASKKRSMESQGPTTPLEEEFSTESRALRNAQRLITGIDTVEADSTSENQAQDDLPVPTFYTDMVEKHQTRILSTSPFVKFMQPYLLMCAREQERRLVYLKRLRDQDIVQEQNAERQSLPQRFLLIQPEMIHQTLQDAPKKVLEVLHAVHDAEYDKALYVYETTKRQWETYIAGNVDLFDPYAHQNIVVLYSLVCTATTIPCAGPDLLALAYYNEHATVNDFEPDCTLGQFVEEICLGAGAVCTANGCEKQLLEHHRSYVHGDARVSIFVEKHPCKIHGLQNTILMWSYCQICKKETQVMPMSESTWKYSFGKYLELSFWSKNLRLRAGVCPHDLHRDHVRYFGYHDYALRIHHDPIELLEIVVPRARITWNVENDLRLKNDIYGKTDERLNRFMGSVKARIKGISADMVISEKAEACKLEMDKLMKRANEDHLRLLRKLQKRYMNSKYYETIPLNRAVRALQEKVAEWDTAFADFEANFFPSERDIRRLAALQMKRLFLDRDESMTSVTSPEGGGSTYVSEVENAQADVTTEPKDSTAESKLNIAEQPTNVATLPSGIETTPVARQGSEDTASQSLYSELPAPPVEEPKAADSQFTETSGDEIRYLDLAVPDFSPKRRSKIELVSVDPRDESGKISGQEVLKIQPGTGEITEGANAPIPAITSPASASRKGSGIPRPVEGFHRKKGTISLPLMQTRSQPVHQARLQSRISQSEDSGSIIRDQLKAAELMLLEKSIMDNTNPSRRPAQSGIPRLVPVKRDDSHVSTLARHFEQLSREFEKERLRERRQRAAKNRRSRVYPMSSSKAIVEVYQNVHEAVDEKEPSDDDVSAQATQQPDSLEGIYAGGDPSGTTTPSLPLQTPVEETLKPEEQTEDTKTDVDLHVTDRTTTDTVSESGEEDYDIQSEIYHRLPVDGSETISNLDLKLELPKHEKSSLMKMLSNFWAERSASGWAPLDYPLGASDHVFLDSDIIIREDEPSSLIAFALSSDDYRAKLDSIRRQGVKEGNREKPTSGLEQVTPSASTEQIGVETSLLRSTGTHLKYQFQEGSARMLCKIFYAEQFDAVRRKCGIADRIVESLSRCVKWDSKGGKTRSVFLKTLDERFVLKSLSPVETQAFLRFAPAYFQIMSEALFHELPTVIAKMLGFFQIHIKNPATGVEIKWNVLIMENLFYDRSPTRIFDLKGSMRNRKIQSTGQQNEVLLDENMVEFIYESPLFVREHSKKLLRASVWNDTLFLARQNVMDYSLMIAVDEDRRQLVVGIVDCIRTYTWDKKLESWIKDRGFAGGSKNKPTVTSPKEYKSRFREAMARYVLLAPNCWHQFQAHPVDLRPTVSTRADGHEAARQATTNRAVEL